MARSRGRLRAARRGIVAVAGGGACGRPARVARARGAHVFLSRSCVVWVFVSLFFFFLRCAPCLSLPFFSSISPHKQTPIGQTHGAGRGDCKDRCMPVARPCATGVTPHRR